MDASDDDVIFLREELPFTTMAMTMTLNQTMIMK